MPSAEGERMCRICMSDESEVELTRPCACRGSLAYACTDCIVHAAVAAWEGGAAEPKRCKQCMQEYGTSLRLAITRAQAAKASAHADEAGEARKALSRLGRRVLVRKRSFISVNGGRPDSMIFRETRVFGAAMHAPR